MSRIKKLYDREYFLTSVEGAKEFLRSKGLKLSSRLAKVIFLADPKPSDAILDLGCGRGELILNCALKGSTAIGCDFSSDALKLAKSAIDQLPLKNNAFLCQADVKYLPFRDGIFDLIFLIDVAEHLYPDELRKCLTEIYRVLKSTGTVIIHTDNAWYHNFGSFLLRLINLFLENELELRINMHFCM
ncbi:MAG: class I SAM-dependent methyltransferase [Thermoproteota archaeon]